MKIIEMKVRTVAIATTTHIAHDSGRKVEGTLRMQSCGENNHVIRLSAGN
jgi:hypothetical protein